MSATGRADIRHPDDFYKTPSWATRAILPHLGLDDRSIVLDPCCGDGAILDVVAKDYPRVPLGGLELDEGRATRAQRVKRDGDFIVQRDALSPEPWPGATHIVTNPPFRVAVDFIRRGLFEVASRPGLVAMLLRVNFIASAERRPLHRAHPADIHVLSRRPEFAASLFCVGDKPKGTRKTGCGWTLLQEIDAPRPTRCPTCHVGKLGVTTSDSTEYAWWVWGPGRGGRWFLLDEVA